MTSTPLHDEAGEPILDALMKLADKYAGAAMQVTLDNFVNRTDPEPAERKNMESYQALKSAIASQLLALQADRDRLLEDAEQMKKALLAYADAKYCEALNVFRRDVCLGWEAKANCGKFGQAEFDAHKAANEAMGAHRGIYEALRQIARALSASTTHKETT